MSPAVRRHELTDREWKRIESLLPPHATRGRHYREHRVVLNGMLYWLHTACPWRDLPERYGPWQTIYSRFKRWSRSGVWDQILSALQRDLQSQGSVEWKVWILDGTNIRAHKAAAGAGGKPAPRRARGSRARA